MKRFISFLVKLFILIPSGYILVGAYNSSTIYEFLIKYGCSPTFSIFLVILVGIIWGAPYYTAISEKIIPKLLGESYYINNDSVSSVREMLFENQDHANLSAQEFYKKRKAWLKTHGIDKELYGKILDLFAGSKPKLSSENLAEIRIQLKCNKGEYSKQILAFLADQYLTKDITNITEMQIKAPKHGTIRKLIIGFFSAMGILNILISPIGRMIGGNEIAKSQLGLYWQKILIILGIVAGLFAWTLNKKAVDAFTSRLASNFGKLRSYKGKILALISTASLIVFGYLIVKYPLLFSKLTAACIIFNIMLFIIFIRYNYEKNLFKSINKALKKSAPYLAFTTALPITAYATYTAAKVTDVITTVFNGKPLNSLFLNSLLAILALIVTLVCTYGFLSLFSVVSPQKAHRNMDPNRFNRQLTIDPKILKSINKYNLCFFTVVYVISLCPTICMGIMAYGSVMANLKDIVPLQLAKFFSIILALTSIYLSYRFFTVGTADIIRTLFPNKNITRQCQKNINDNTSFTKQGKPN